MATMAAMAIERSRMFMKVKGKEARAERTNEVRLSLYLIKYYITYVILGHTSKTIWANYEEYHISEV